MDRVKQWWNSYHFQGSLCFILACKLKALKSNLRKRNEDLFGNIERQKNILLEELQGLDIIEEERASCDKEEVRKAKVK